MYKNICVEIVKYLYSIIGVFGQMVGQQQYAGSVTCSDLDVNKGVIFCMLFKKNICVISLNYLYYNRGAWQWLDEKAACC